MVLEILVNPTKVKGKPWEMFFIGVVYSLVGVMLGYWVFRSHVSLVMVAFTSIASIPFVHSAIKAGEERGQGKKEGQEESLFQKYAGVLTMFTFLFLGFVAVFVLLFVTLPAATVTHIFSTQINAIGEVRTSVAGNVTGNFMQHLSTFTHILFNNIKVLFFTLLFSIVYGAGAIFILSWNASVMGAAIGDAIREKVLHVGVLEAVSLSLAGYFVHGIPEIFAYFAGGLAGGVLSVALVQSGFQSIALQKAWKDCLNLTAFAALTLFFAGLIEVYISPTLL
ncbi:MAG: stage II sporulation protein M [Nanoarchaeota archaeon]